MPKVKTIIYLIGTGLVAALILLFSGYFWGRASIKPPPPDTVSVPDTVWSVKWKTDTLPNDTIYLPKDTFVITGLTPIGQIPIRTRSFYDSIPIMIRSENQYHYIRFEESVDYRGIIQGYSIRTIPTPFVIEGEKAPKPFPVRPFISVSTDYLLATADDPAHLKASAEIGFTLWQRADIHLVAEYNQHIYGGVGLRYLLMK